jgi:hypothetical protein
LLADRTGFSLLVQLRGVFAGDLLSLSGFMLLRFNLSLLDFFTTLSSLGKMLL